MNRRRILLSLVLCSASTFVFAADQSTTISLHTRSRKPVPASSDWTTIEKVVDCDPQKTAIVVVDMWDVHWCEAASKRVAEMAGPMNNMIAAARDRGMLIIHCPSGVVDFYKDSAPRKRAREATPAVPSKAATSIEQWGTRWSFVDAPREPQLPIDDTDNGCDCDPQCKTESPWTRQIAAIQIHDDRDAMTDNGQEVYNLLQARNIDNVLICGVHLNMCVLGRPFGIRQLTKLGKNVVLIRDMTDTMYNHRMRPFVDHFAGTRLVVEHVEKYWCPTIESTDLVGGKPFSFANDRKASSGD